MFGTILNTITILIGGSLGTVVGHRFPSQMQETIFAALGLFTLVIGVDSALVTQNPLIVLVSLLLGALVGEGLHLELRLEQIGVWLQRRLARDDGGSRASRFVEGFVSASLVFCIGPLAIQGAIEDGLVGDYTKLAIKSMMDGFASLAFAASLGPGVIASALFVLVFQGTISLLAKTGSQVFSEAMIMELTATGGVVLLAIGLRLLELKHIRAANLLPALFIAPAAIALLDKLGIS